MKITEINITDKAKRKIQNIAKNNHLDFDLVYAVFSFYWNYDGKEGEWVINLEKDEDYRKRNYFIRERLNLNNKIYQKDEIIEIVYDSLKSIDKNKLFEKFLIGAMQKDYCSISRYASYHYLNNATKEKLNFLVWKGKELDCNEIIWWIFCKLFRAGSVDRYNLKYLFADLTLQLPYLSSKEIKIEDWTKEFIEKIDDKMKLSDLIKILKGFCKGDKYFLQTILEALSYSGILEVKNYSVKDIFIPDYRDKLSHHFYSNEWSFPLRFWNEKDRI